MNKEKLQQWWARAAEQKPALIDLMVWVKTFTLPGFEGIPVYDVIRFFIQEIRANSLSIRSRSIAYSFFLALFPALIFVFALIPYIPYFKNLDKTVFDFLNQVLPDEHTFHFVQSLLHPLVADLSKRRGMVLIGSMVMVIMLTSDGVMAMMSSFDKNYEHYRRRNPIQSRIVALQITFLLMLLFLLSVVLIVAGQEIFGLLFKWLGIKSRMAALGLLLLRYGLLILTFFFGLSLIYYYGPATRKKYRFISAGATVATLLSLLVSVGFSYWVSNFNKLNVVFGSIGTVMLLMIWLNVNSFVLLIGYEINASIYYNRTLRTKELELKKDAE